MRLHKRFFLVRQMESRLQNAVLDVIYAKPGDVGDNPHLAEALAEAGQTAPGETILTSAEILSPSSDPDRQPGFEPASSSRGPPTTSPRRTARLGASSWPAAPCCRGSYPAPIR